MRVQSYTFEIEQVAVDLIYAFRNVKILMKNKSCVLFSMELLIVLCPDKIFEVHWSYFRVKTSVNDYTTVLSYRKEALTQFIIQN